MLYLQVVANVTNERICARYLIRGEINNLEAKLPLVWKKETIVVSARSSWTLIILH